MYKVTHLNANKQLTRKQHNTHTIGSLGTDFYKGSQRGCRRECARCLSSFLAHPPVNPVVLIPCTRYRWKKTKIAKTGTSDNEAIAKIAPQSVPVPGSANPRSASESVYIFGLLR